MALALIRPTYCGLCFCRPDKAKPPSGKQAAPATTSHCRMALTLIRPTYCGRCFCRPDKAQPPSGKQAALATTSHCRMALTLIRPTYCGRCFCRPDKAQPPSGKQAAPATTSHCRMALTLIRPTNNDRGSVTLSLHHTHMGGDNPPSERELHPRLHLAADALAVFAGKLGARHRHLIPEGGNGGVA